MDGFGLIIIQLGLFVLGKWILKPYFEWKESRGSLISDSIEWCGKSEGTDSVTSTLFQPATLQLSLVMPAYNEEDRMPKALSKAIELLELRSSCVSTPSNNAKNNGRKFIYEIIVVDDGSNDKTKQVALECGNKCGNAGSLCVIRLSSNMGKGFAVKVGVLCAAGEQILMLDADGATEFEDIEKLETLLYCDGNPSSPSQSAEAANNAVHSACDASETMKQAIVNWQQLDADNTHSIADNVLAYNQKRDLCLVVFGSRKDLVEEAVSKAIFAPNNKGILSTPFVQDTQCGFKLFGREAARCIFGSLQSQRWAFDIEIVVIANMLGYKISETSVRWTEVPGSKLNLFQASFQMARDICLIKVLYGLRIWHPNWKAVVEAIQSSNCSNGTEGLSRSPSGSWQLIQAPE